MRSRVRPLCASVALLGSLASGCATRIPYPDDWAPPTPASTTECPRIEGRYVNDGALAQGNDDSICNPGTSFRHRLSWTCDRELATNLADMDSSDWVELRQPDPDTLLVVSSDARVDVKELHRSKGDFSCGPEGLRRSQYASVVSVGDDSADPGVGLTIFNTVETAFGALMMTGGLTTLTRTFNVAQDGSLVMSVSLSQTGVYMLIPYHIQGKTFVRWQRVTADSDAVVTPAAETATLATSPTAAPAPSELVARFQPLRGIVSWTFVDGVDDEPAFAAITDFDPPPQVIAAGQHWITLEVKSATLIPLRDFSGRYGFALDAIAGHTYTPTEQPTVCVSPDKDPNHAEPAIVYRRQLSLIDRVRGKEVGRITVDALCATQGARACRAGQPPPDADAPAGTSCVTLAGSDRGFWGVQAVGK
jgi:hypothetical protein